MFPSVTRELYTSPSTLSTSPTPASPTCPTRTGRLRGLNYLRSYTQTHLSSRESRDARDPHDTPIGSLGQQFLASQRSASVPLATESLPRQLSPTTHRATAETNSPNTAESLGSTSGWLPTVGGHSVAARVATEPQSTVTSSSSAVLSPINASIMARTRTNLAVEVRDQTQGHVRELGDDTFTETDSMLVSGMPHQLPSIRFSAHQDPRVQRPSLIFSPVTRILPTGKEVIKVGRYSEKDTLPSNFTNIPSSAPVGFKSKVVSRRHCEFWCANGRWFIKDVKSSSGTFLNHIRLTSPGTESKAFPVNDGDVVQLGIDFKGGEELIFRCVKMRVELNKGWQNGPSSFNVQSHKRLRELNNMGKPATSSSQDCSICLGPIAPCQSLFVAPCSHTWHYKCIRVIINGPHWPHFICPNCRAVADLEAELDDPSADGGWENAERTSDDSPATANEIAGAFHAQERTAVEDTAPRLTADAYTEPGRTQSDEDLSQEDMDPGIANAVQDLNYLNLGESPSPPEGTRPQPDHSTVPPVDIIARRPIPAISNGIASHLEQTLDANRTPSPGDVGSPDPMLGVEGPMTPTNDVGPFIIDGKAGKLGSSPRKPSIGTAAGNSTAESSNVHGAVDASRSSPTTR